MQIDTIKVNARHRKDLGNIDALAASIREIGLLNPIAVTEGGVLIAGRRRLEACKRLGWEEIEARVLSLNDLGNELAEIDENLIRDDLSCLERAEHLYRRKEIYEAMHPETKHGGAPGKAGGGKKPKDEIISSFASDTASKTGVTPRTVQHEVQIVEKIDAEVRDAIRGTDVADRKTDLLWLAKMDTRNQKSVSEKIVSGEAKGLADAVRQVKKDKRDAERREAAEPIREVDSRILVGDFRDHADSIPDGSLSLIFTDPPYDRKASKMLPDLAAFAATKLADGGSLLCYVGQTQLPTALDVFREHLRYWWINACVHAGKGAVMREYGINNRWKAVLWFVKGTRHDNTVMVLDAVSGGKEKEHHEWQQSEAEAEYWIEKLCQKDGIVCDPFLGSGTTAKAANRVNRKWIGMEIDPNVAKIATGRLAE